MNKYLKYTLTYFLNKKILLGLSLGYISSSISIMFEENAIYIFILGSFLLVYVYPSYHKEYLKGIEEIEK